MAQDENGINEKTKVMIMCYRWIQ